jgi:hypothetical protein
VPIYAEGLLFSSHVALAAVVHTLLVLCTKRLFLTGDMDFPALQARPRARASPVVQPCCPQHDWRQCAVGAELRVTRLRASAVRSVQAAAATLRLLERTADRAVGCVPTATIYGIWLRSIPSAHPAGRRGPVSALTSTYAVPAHAQSQSQRRYGKGEPSPGEDVARVPPSVVRHAPPSTFRAVRCACHRRTASPAAVRSGEAG